MSTTWHFRLNGGVELTTTTHSSVYEDGVRAAVDIVAADELLKPVVVEIWVPSLLSDYGPYHYHVVLEDERVSVSTAVTS